MDDEYIEPWRKESKALAGGTGNLPLMNSHLVQLQPRRDKRNPALDEAIEREKELARQRRYSGHSLIR